MKSDRRRVRSVTSLVAVVAALGAVLLTGCGSAKKSAGDGGPLTVIKFAGPSAPNGIMAQVAYGEKEGIFKKHGFDFRISYPANTATSAIVPLIAKGTFTMSYATPSAMMANYESGVKTTAILGFLEKNPTGISLRKSKGIMTPQQLKGATLGVSTGSANIQVTPKYLAHYGLTEKDVRVEVLSLAALPTALVSGKIDGVIAFPYAIDPILNSEGIETNDLLYNAAGINEIQQVFAVGNDWIAAHKPVLPELVNALREATAGAIKDPATAAKDLVSTAPATAPKASVTQAQWEATEPFLTSPNTKGHPVGYMAPEDWAETLRFSEQFLGLKHMDPAAVYTNQYIK